jgi:hypothetical protein
LIAGISITGDEAMRVDFYWRDIGNGSAQHYWHFMLGYFLPLVRILLNSDQFKSTAHIGLYDCGPIMNRLVREVLEPWGLRIDFDANLCTKREAGSTAPAIVLDRWDVWLLDDARKDELAQVLSVKDQLADALRSKGCCDHHLAADQLLVLQRSPEPEFYGPAGGAIKKTYGTGRRTLREIEKGCAALNAMGVKAMIYEPGAHNLACQIAHFSICAGVVGVRGAEFANILWTAPEAKIILFLSTSFPNAPPPRALSRILRRAYAEIDHLGEVSPALDASRIMPLLKG